jgi:predicted phage baseplate assembly protein
MTLPVVNLDDRQFADLAAESRERLRQALPELAGLSPADPLYFLVDCFAHLTSELILRANLLPERQRRVFLNLLAVPERPARPARTLVSLDLDGKAAAVPRLVPKETALAAGKLPFTTEQEVLATPLVLRLMQKRTASADATVLAQLYPELPTASIRTFAAVEPVAGRDTISTAGTVDDALYLALCVPKGLAKPQPLARARRALLGAIINIGLMPRREVPATQYTTPATRVLDWSIAWCRTGTGAGSGSGGRPDCRWLPLPVLTDGTNGGRETGVVRLQLPEAEALLTPVLPADPADAGLGESPPALPADVEPAALLCWLRLRAPDGAGGFDALELAHIAINAVIATGQGVERDLVVGIGSGQSGQRVTLARRDIDPASLRVQVQRGQSFEDWWQVAHFAASGPDDPVYRFDAATGVIQFGDGQHGRRPAAEARIRIASLRYGGGAGGNVPAGTIKALATPITGVKVRHEVAAAGGIDAESVSAAEQRIAETLRHRNRAVTAPDFVTLTLANPVNPVARVEVLPGFHPGRELADARAGVPGVVSLLVLPPATDDGRFPRPNAGLLRDVHGYLAERMLLGTELYVLSPAFVPIGMTAVVDAIDPGRTLAVEAEVRAALAAYLWPLAPGGLGGTGWQLGRAVEAGELYTAIARVPGVRAIHGIQLHEVGDDGGWRAAAGNRVELPAYGLPELVAMAVAADGPGSVPVLDDAAAPATDATTTPVTPVPVTPSLC